MFTLILFAALAVADEPPHEPAEPVEPAAAEAAEAVEPADAAPAGETEELADDGEEPAEAPEAAEPAEAPEAAEPAEAPEAAEASEAEEPPAEAESADEKADAAGPTVDDLPGYKKVSRHDVQYKKRHGEMKYPPAAVDLELGQVRCIARVYIDARGEPVRVDVEECPVVFHAEVQKGLMDGRWYPYKQDRRPVPVQFLLGVAFHAPR